MKYCEEYAALLDLYVDAELTYEALQRVEAHLAECPACRAYVDDALAIRAAFADLEEVEVPEGFADSVCAAIRAQAAPRKAKKTVHWGRTLASLAACCAVVILLRFGPASNKDTAAPRMKSMNASAAESATADMAMPAEEAKLEVAETESYSMQAADGGAGEKMTAVVSGSAPAETEEAVAEEAAEPADSKNKTTAEAQDETAAETEPASPENGAMGDTALSELILPAEAAEFLAAFTPAEETETRIEYRLTPSECEWLEQQLAEAGIDYLVGVSINTDDDTVLVILSK